jgi:hypothetical protein
MTAVLLFEHAMEVVQQCRDGDDEPIGIRFGVADVGSVANDAIEMGDIVRHDTFVERLREFGAQYLDDRSNRCGRG